MAFRDFINGKNTNDEIYFYLVCRDAINQGPALSDRKNCFEMVQREELKKTLAVVRKILLKFPDRDTNSIIEKIQQSAVLKQNGKEYLDSGFVLKVLLELYRADKKIRYEYMVKDLNIQKQIFEVLPRKGQQTPNPDLEFLSSYENFRKFTEKHFPFMGETDKLEFFCECYNVGMGIITFETYYTIVHEFGLLIGDMKIKQLILESQPDGKKDLNQKFFQKIKRNQPNEYKMRDLIIGKMESCGLERLAHEIKSIEGCLDGRVGLTRHQVRLGLERLHRAVQPTHVSALKSELTLTYRHAKNHR
jgi:hypothetical protein